MNINSNIAPFVSITWHQKEPLGCVVYLHFPNNDSYSKCIHSCCLPCSYVTKPVGILQRVIKGYLRYKMITSQNVLSEDVLKCVIKSMTSWWVLVHEIGYRVYFWIYLLNQNSLNHQTWSIERYKQGQ